MEAAGHSPHQERILALEKELGEFAYIVSHDLAASFRHIRGFSDLLRLDAGVGFSPEQNSYCNQIQSATDKCAGMLEHILMFSRMSAKPLAIVNCDLALVLDTLRLQLGAEIRRSGAQIEVDAPGRVQADQALLTQALKHLLDNAIKFRRQGTAPRVRVWAFEDAQQCRIRIGDDGIGLPPGVDFERLFWMFYRGDPENFPGGGAGLAMARRIIRRHGGDVTFVDWPGGTCVEIQLPRRDPV